MDTPANATTAGCPDCNNNNNNLDSALNMSNDGIMKQASAVSASTAAAATTGSTIISGFSNKMNVNSVNATVVYNNSHSNSANQKYSGVTSPDMYCNKKNWFSMNSFQKLSSQSSVARERVINIIRVLAELLTSSTVPYPLYVGLFNKTSPGIRTTHLNKLAEEISNCTKPICIRCLEPSYLLILFPCITATVCGMVLGLTINWVFGIVFGASSMIVILSLIGLILIGSRTKRSSKATFASRKLARLMEILELLLQVLFCYPKDTDLLTKPVTPLIMLLNLSDYVSVNHLSLGIVEQIWETVENKYFRLLTRLQSSCKITESDGGRFKSVCCIPTFALVILFFSAVFINGTLLSIYRRREIMMFTNTNVLPIFVIMTCIIFLGFFGILPIISKTAMVLLRSPARALKLMRTSSDHLDYKTVDALVKEELERVCLIISAFEAYQCKEQLRIFIMINTTDTCNRQILANCIYQVQNLTMLRTTVPIISVLAADFQNLVTDWNVVSPLMGGETNFFQQFSDSFHLIHSTFHLPVYLDECFPTAPTRDKNPHSSTEIFCLRGGSSFESLNMAITGSKSTPLPISTNHSGTPLQISGCSKTNNASSTPTPAGGGVTSSNIRLLKTSDSHLSLKKIQQMFLSKSEITEINNKIIKQLLITANFLEKILRINKVDFSLDQITDWIPICLHWPFRLNWMLCCSEGDRINKLQSLAEDRGESEEKLPLGRVLEILDPFQESSMSLDKNFILLAQDDKSIDTLIRAVSGDLGSFLSLENAHLLAYYSCFINPYFYGIIKDHLNENALEYPTKHIADAKSPENPRKSEENIHSNPDVDDDGMKTPVAVRKCFNKLKSSMKSTELSQMQKKEVLSLLSYIDTIEQSYLATYQQRLMDLNVTGLVLSICDLDNLQRELQMKFGDWQVFKALVLYLRELESVKMITFSDSEELQEDPFSPRTFDNLAFWTENEHAEYSEDNEHSQPKSAGSSVTHKDTTPIIKDPVTTVANSSSRPGQMAAATRKLRGKVDKKKVKPSTNNNDNNNNNTNNNNNDNNNVNNNPANKSAAPQHPAHQHSVYHHHYHHQFHRQPNGHHKSMHRRSYHDGYYYQETPNPAYVASMSESVDKLSSKSQQSIHKDAVSNHANYEPVISSQTYLPTMLLSSNVTGGCNNAAAPMVNYNNPEGSSNDEQQQVGNKQCTCDYWFTFGKEKIPLARVVSEPVHYITSDAINCLDDDEDDGEDGELNTNCGGGIGVSGGACSGNSEHCRYQRVPDQNSVSAAAGNMLDYSEEENPRLSYMLPDSVHSYRAS